MKRLQSQSQMPLMGKFRQQITRLMVLFYCIDHTNKERQREISRKERSGIYSCQGKQNTYVKYMHEPFFKPTLYAQIPTSCYTSFYRSFTIQFLPISAQYFKNMERNRSIKNRLFQTLGNRSPKQPFMLEEGQTPLAPILKPKKSQESLTITPSNARALPMYKLTRGAMLSPVAGEHRKRPQEVKQEKLSQQAKSMVEQGKNRLRTNLKPHDIFQLYQSFPEMLEDFFYLNRVSHPYDYQIVTYAQRNPQEYMTISSQGLTLYHDKEAQFLTREQWLTDEKRYYQLQRIYFFKQYKLSKNFRIWKNKMRRHYMREMSAILSEHLFLTVKYPRSCLLAVRHHTNALRDSLCFFPYETMERLGEAQFQALMVDYRQKVLLKGIREITNQITTALEGAVAEEINKFKLENNIKIDGVHERGGTGKEGYVYSQEAILRKQYKRVYKLIKLADSMLQEAKIEMVLKCLQQLLDRIKQLQGEDRQPWVTCVATIAQDGAISWQPDCPALTALFIRAITTHIAAISDHNQKIVLREAFSKYRLADCGEVKGQQGRGSFKSMIEESPQYSVLMGQISTILAGQFLQTGKEEALLGKFVQIYLRHRSLTGMGSIFHENNGVELCNYVQEWKRDEKEMHELTQDKKGRLILYNFADLRKKIVTVPRQTLSSFLSLLPEETISRCRELISQSRALLQLISVYPTEIVSFAKFNRAVRQASQRLQDIRSAGSQICLLIDLMGKNKLGNIQLYNAKKIQALNSITLLKNKVDQSQAKENESLSKFKKDNEAEVTKIKTTIKELAGKFNAIDFNQTKVTAKEMKDILARIRDILPAISALQAQSRKIQEIEIELNLTQTDFAEVHELYQNAKLVHDIWSTRDDWKTTLVSLYHKHYCEVDTAELRKNWEDFSNRINALAKLLPDNDILKNLTQQLLQVEVLIDTIVALRSPNLQEKSWREISEYLAYELGLQNDAELPFSNTRNPLYTVRWLLEINIPVYKEKIEFIVRKSQKERELGQHLSQYKAFIANLSFDLLPKKRQVYLLAENTDLMQKLQSYLGQLYSMLDNQYSQPIKLQAESLIRHYEYVEEIIKAVVEFGSIWSRYESFFDGNSNSLKLLTKESKEFFSWETQWKKILKNITADAILFYKKVTDQTTGLNCSRSMIKQIAKINITIEQVKKGLDEYLEKKRAAFPRYFFIPDEQLLRMLAGVDSREPITQSFVGMLYANIEKILYKEDTKDTLLGIISKEGEHFPLKNVSFKLQSEMQEIFKQTQEQIKKRLGYLIKTAFAKYIEEEITREAMILDNNAQVVLAIDAIAWVRLAEETYLCSEPIGDLYDWLEIQNAQIKELRALFDTAPREQHMRLKLMQVMSQAIYQREKTELLLNQNVASTECYEWERIPKLCMSSNNSEVFLRQLNTRLNYCYQFLSNRSASFILPHSERAWVSIAQAISNRQVICLDGYQQGHEETVRELGYVIAQEVEKVHMSAGINFKNIERFISGALFTGSWVVMNLPGNHQVMAFLAHQLNHIRKAILDPNLEKSKAQFINSNAAFFLTIPSNLTQCALEAIAPSLSHRSITLSKPNYCKIFSIIAECECGVAQIGTKTISICDIVRESFASSLVRTFDKQSCQQVLQRAMAILPNYEWLKQLKCKEFYEFIICDALDAVLLPILRKEDVKAYEHLKTCIVPDYEKLKLRHPSAKSDPNAIVAKFLERSGLLCLKKVDFMQELELMERAVTSNHLGVILHGDPLSGKSTLIDLACKMLQEKQGRKIKLHRVYHGAYNKEEVFSSQKSPAIFSEIMNETSPTNWVIFDGALSLQYLEIFGSEAQRYLIPQIGAFPAPAPALPAKFKFICETCDISALSPGAIGNHSLVHLGDVLSTESIIRRLFVKLDQKKWLGGLQGETIEWLVSGLVNMMGKLENRSLLKAKQVGFVYPLAAWQLTQRVCRTIEAVFVMNWQSVREKEKSMRKLVDRFVAWCAYWSLLGVVVVEDEPKLQKLIGELYRSDGPPEDLASCIIYPGCGLEVQPVNGLRTQSSLQIPQRGIITNLLRSDLLAQGDHQKGNKFYQQIVISQPQVIRVNYQQSNRYNYLSQLAYLTATPVLSLGAPNTGKKSIMQLFAKNMRNKSQYYSIRYRNRDTLPAQIERPFRKLITLDGLILKSVSASKRLIISIEDISLVTEQARTGEFLRQVFNEGGYFNKQAQWTRFSNNRFHLIASRLAPTPSNLRLIAKTAIFQSASTVTEKLHAIYSPYLKNWAAFNGLGGEVERIFSSENGDTLLDATLAVFKLMEELHREEEKGSLERMLLRPRIGDVAKVLTYICKTPQASHYNLTYYHQLWTHQVVRVFGDRLCSARHRQQLFKELKKQSLVKFKENFTLSYSSMYNFTSLGIENDNCYIRIEDPSFLHTYISNLLQADQINLPLKFLFDQLLEHIIKIYRVISVEGAHMLLLAHNAATARYLIELACQVGQNDYFSLKGNTLSVERHIQPTLYYKDNVCFTDQIDRLSPDSLYQIACLLNYNVYDFAMKPQTREKVRVSLNKKEKIQVEKKESKAFSKTNKAEQARPEQKEEDIDTLMTEQFMNFAHFVFQASPTSPQLRQFLSRQHDIVGQLQFCWVDIPQESILKVARQILSFDQQTSELVLEGHSNDALVEKVRTIFQTQPIEGRYFNDVLIINQLVKNESGRLSGGLLQRQKEIKQGRQIFLKVRAIIEEKEEKMRVLQEEIEEVNLLLEGKCRELENVHNSITQWQITTNSEENGNAEGLSQLRVQREEKEIQLKLIKERKEQLEPEKKKILKSIKIANDYLEIFDNSLDSFDSQVAALELKVSLLQDKLIIVWSIATYLLNTPVSEWLQRVNQWIHVINSKIPVLISEQSLLQLVEEVCPLVVSRPELFCPSLRLKAEMLVLLLANYEETAHYGRIIRVHDPKGILPFVLQHLSPQDNPNYILLKSFPSASRESRGEIETLCKMKNGLVVIQSERDVDELELNLSEKKMCSYLNKIIVQSNAASAQLTLDCDQRQLLLSVENFILKQVNTGLFQERLAQSQEVMRQLKKKKEDEELFYRASSTLNIETETYTEELNKYKTMLQAIEESLKNLAIQSKLKKHLEFPQFQMHLAIFRALASVWKMPEITLKHIPFVYHQSIYIRNCGENEQADLEEKGAILQDIVNVNLGGGDEPLGLHLKFSKKWDNRVKLYLVPPCRKTLEQLEFSKEYKLINFLATPNIIPHLNQNSSALKILFNFIPSLHLPVLAQAIDLQLNDSSERIIPFIIMAAEEDLKELQASKIRIVEAQLQIESGVQIQRQGKNKWAQNVKNYLTNLSKNKEHTSLALSFIEKCSELAKNQEELAKLLSDVLNLPVSTIIALLTLSPEDLTPYLYAHTLPGEHKQKRGTEVGKNCQQVGSIKEELPFNFNITEFLPSKDPLAAQLIAQCLLFNKKLREVKEHLKDPQLQWQQIERIIPSSKLIQSLNNQYQLLRRNLVKLHLLNNNPASNARSASHKTFSSGNILFQNVMRLPRTMLTPKILTLLRCRAAKKFKNKLANIYLQWKVCSQSFSFEENLTFAELSLVTEGAMVNGKLLQNAWTNGCETMKKIELVAFAIQSPQEPRQNPLSLYIPIRNGKHTLGHLQICKGELGSEYIAGLQSAEIVIEQ